LRQQLAFVVARFDGRNRSSSTVKALAEISRLISERANTYLDEFTPS
jgi:hypothetical protein